jgi:hypothetical protein
MAAKKGTRPNIILFTTDAGRDDLGCQVGGENRGAPPAWQAGGGAL